MEHVSQAGQQAGDVMQGSALSASFLCRQHGGDTQSSPTSSGFNFLLVA
jgi:hypothetical protein